MINNLKDVIDTTLGSINLVAEDDREMALYLEHLAGMGVVYHVVVTLKPGNILRSGREVTVSMKRGVGNTKAVSSF